MTMTTCMAGRRLQAAMVGRLVVVAFVLHWAWEATHAVAFVESAGPFLFRLRHCLPMAGIDAVWTLGLWALVGGLSTSGRPIPGRLVALGSLGALTAILLERSALAEHRWTYNALMPVLPVLDVGLWPVLQMIAVPVVSVWLSRRSSPKGR
ncbi:MAG: hypothetical protein ABI880_15040 [Acidobacteriota bacterium]